MDDAVNKMQKISKSRTELNKKLILAPNAKEETEDYLTSSTEDTFSENSTLSGKYLFFTKITKK